MGVTANRYGVSFWSDKSALKRIVVMVAQHCEYTKKPQNGTPIWYIQYISIKLLKKTTLKLVLQ